VNLDHWMLYQIGNIRQAPNSVSAGATGNELLATSLMASPMAAEARDRAGMGTNPRSNYYRWCRPVANPIPSGFESRFLRAPNMPLAWCIKVPFWAKLCLLLSLAAWSPNSVRGTAARTVRGGTMPSSVWSGHLTFGLISMPVRLFSGARSSGISFNMLHRTDKSRLKQQYICQAEGVVVERSDMVKGYEFRKDEYIIIEPDEIKKIEPQTAKTMEILEFVKTSEVDPVYFESSYYMMPEEAGRRPYALLTKALEESEYVAIAQITMHNREYTVFLRPHEGGMMLHTMYYEEEVKKVEGFGAPDVELKDAEVKVAHQLIEALADEWNPEKYKDNFQENLKKLIETKLEGGEVAEVEQPKKLAPVVDLMAALKQSLAQMEGKKKPAATAGSDAPVATKSRRGR
jgi:DNA end-binding protein Ku